MVSSGPRPTVVAVSGSIASGKTTLAGRLATALRWKHASFGRWLRLEATHRGLDPSSRDVLRDLGATVIEEGWDRFCRSVLNDAGWEQGDGLVVEGVRHREALQAIGTIVSPMDVFLVYVLVSDDVREERVHRRGNTPASTRELDQHPSESQVAGVLASMADLQVSGSAPIDSVVSRVIETLQGRESPTQ